MGQSRGTRVFILGAGCSAECGYLLGAGFKTALQQFHSQISDDCPAIRESVDNTITLLESLSDIKTLDQLARHIDEELESWRKQRNWSGDVENCRRDKLAENQILDAKIATAALFLTLEENIPQVGLTKYDSFLISIFGGRSNTLEDMFSEADCHVLSFNYDRMFEIAFMNRFKHFDLGKYDLYSGRTLNSGFDAKRETVKPLNGHFSFLKLHGSAAWWVKSGPSEQERSYCAPAPKTPIALKDIEALATKARNDHEWKPLIAFPHERQSSRGFYQENNKSSGYHWAPYIDAAWNYAGSLLAQATEVNVIGYSFDPNDSRYMVKELLSRVPTAVKIMIRNRKEAETDVRRNVESYSILSERIEYDPKPF